MDFNPLECPSELLEIRKSDRCYRPIRRHCDCDTTLGIISRRGGIFPKRKMKKLEKNPQITEEGLEKLMDEEKKSLLNNPETNQWFDFLRALLNGGDVWHMGLLIHWAPDPLIINEVIKIPQKEITKELLLKIKADTFYEFMREVNY